MQSGATYGFLLKVNSYRLNATAQLFIIEQFLFRLSWCFFRILENFVHIKRKRVVKKL